MLSDEISQLRRFDTNPLINFDSYPPLGENICGPSVIRAPDWLTALLGQYYMYFAHHSGKHIRLAYADALDGPLANREANVLLGQGRNVADVIQQLGVSQRRACRFVRQVSSTQWPQLLFAID